VAFGTLNYLLLPPSLDFLVFQRGGTAQDLEKLISR
jgi:hypothetical protein